MQSDVKVLYIAGYPRSGSTLLERLLGNGRGLVSVGELRRIWERGFLTNELCSCGAPFRDCPFWPAVLEEAFGGPEGVDAPALAKAVQSYEARGARWREVTGRVAKAPATPQAQLLSQVLPPLYRAILAVSAGSVIVDSSKDSTYGLLLAGTPGIEVEIVHLVRDSRAVARGRRPHPSTCPRSARRALRWDGSLATSRSRPSAGSPTATRLCATRTSSPIRIGRWDAWPPEAAAQRTRSGITSGG